MKKIFYGDTNDNRIYSFDTIRFFLFIFIFVHHCFNIVKIPILRQPSLAVSGFIILSGFLSGYIYCKKDLKINETFNFTFKRIKKFYPLHLIMLFICIGISGAFNLTTFNSILEFVKKIFCNIFLIQSWINDPSYYFSFNGVTWFLSTYLFLVLITIPVLNALKKVNSHKHNNILLILLSIILFSLTLIIVYLIKKNGADDKFCEFWIYVFPPSRIFEYIIGMIFGIICCNIKKEFKYDKVIFSVFEIITLFILFMFITKFNGFYLFNSRFNTWIIPMILILVTFSFRKGIISKLFSFKPTVYLGEISMYMFLIHQPIINYMNKYVVHYRYMALYILLLTILVSHIINKYEKYRNKTLFK